MKNFKNMTPDELESTNGGKVNVDLNKLVDQINPCKWAYDFGHDVLYPYIWKPLKKKFS